MVEKSDEEEYAKVCYDIINDLYDHTLNIRKDLDEKASKIIIFSGIITGIYSGIGGILLRNPEEDMSYPLIILAIGTVLMVSSIFYSIKAYELKKWKITPSPNKFIDTYVKTRTNKTDILTTMTSTMAEAIESNAKINNYKSIKIIRSLRLFFIGITMSVIFVFLIILN
jgi:hypothetical protein